MQQFKKQSKTENKSTSNLAQMMAQMDKKKNTEKIPEEYYELLKKPRSKRYLELIAQQVQLSDDMEELAIQIRQLEDALDETGESVEESSENAEEASGSGEWWETEEEDEEEAASTEEKAWWEEDSPVTETETESGNDWIQETIDLSQIKAKAEQKKKELQAKKEELERQYQELAQKLEESKKELEQELPVGNGRLGMIYPSYSEQKLLDYGVIAVPGTPFFSQKDLLDQVQPKTEQEEKQWCKGNEYYHLHVNQRRENVLVVEIYLFAICVVYEQGTTVVYRDDK